MAKTDTPRTASPRPAAPHPASPAGMTEAQRAYEAKRAAKAGMSLDKWLDSKRREREQAAKAEAEATRKAVEPPKKPGFLSRLLERAQKPL